MARHNRSPEAGNPRRLRVNPKFPDLPTFGKAKIGAIEQVDIRRFVSDLSKRGAAAGTIRNTFTVLRLVFGTAVASGAIRVNPCTGVRMPRSPRIEMLFLTPDEILTLANAITPRYRVLIIFAAYTGLRAGEIGALRVGRLNLIRGTVDVVESLANVRGKLVFGPTKTYARRSVGMPRFLSQQLGEHLAGQPHGPRDLVFTSPAGGALRHGLFYQRHFKPAVREAGLPENLRFHDLRHTCAALLIARGAHPRAIMERLGHSSIEVTLDRYGHLLPGLDEDLTTGLEHTYQHALGEADGRGRGIPAGSEVVTLPRDPPSGIRKVALTSDFRNHALVAQGIEQRFPKPRAEVRVLPGARVP